MQRKLRGIVVDLTFASLFVLFCAVALPLSLARDLFESDLKWALLLALTSLLAYRHYGRTGQPKAARRAQPATAPAIELGLSTEV